MGARGIQKEHTPKTVQKLDSTDQLTRQVLPLVGVLPLQVCSERVGVHEPIERGKWVMSWVKTYQPDSGDLFSGERVHEDQGPL